MSVGMMTKTSYHTIFSMWSIGSMRTPMKSEFLTNLQGMAVEKAKQAVEMAGHIAYVVPEGFVIAAVAYPNTVILWQMEGRILVAQAGDPIELEG
jgi:hypothetical protein